MKIKHPKFQFLNENENPTLERVFNEAQKSGNNRLPEDVFSNGMFFLNDLLDLKKILVGNIYQQCTESVANLYVVFQAIGCFQSGGLAVGIFGNAPHLVPNLSYALKETAYIKEAEAIKCVKSTFPLITDFYYPELYNAILNFMENPKRKITHAQVQNISMEEKQKFHQSYIKALDEAKPILEQTWLNNPHTKLIDYYNMNKGRELFL